MVSVSMPAPRGYIYHKQQHLVYLSTHYHLFTLKELGEQLGLPWRKIQYLCRTYGIRKRQPNQLPHPTKRAVAQGRK